MKILAFEFSTTHRSVAAVEGASDAEARVLGEAVQAGGDHTRAFALAEQALAEAGWERETVECLAIGLGPGSYTGIRMAIAIAQGWQLARGVRTVGVGTAEALAHEAGRAGMTGRVHGVIDAQRSEFYVAEFAVTATAVELIQPLQLASREAVQSLLDAGKQVIGPDLKAGFPMVKEIFPSAAAVGRLAAGRTDFVSGDQLEPIYLREVNFVKAPPPRIID